LGSGQGSGTNWAESFSWGILVILAILFVLVAGLVGLIRLVTRDERAVTPEAPGLVGDS